MKLVRPLLALSVAAASAVSAAPAAATCGGSFDLIAAVVVYCFGQGHPGPASTPYVRFEIEPDGGTTTCVGVVPLVVSRNGDVSWESSVFYTPVSNNCP